MDYKKPFSFLSQRGNAMIYVLVVIVLFGALTFVLSRQNSTTETGALDEQRVKVYASEIIQVSNQIKQGVDQMIYGGTPIDDLLFCKPSDTCFNSDPTKEVFNPSGGGIVMPKIPAEAIHQVDANPAPGWYLGRFNNVGWTPAAGQDVIFVAHQIREDVCRKINDLLFGDPAPKALAAGNEINKVLISNSDPDGGAQHTGGAGDLDSAACPNCEGKASACVQNNAGTMWSFYNIIEQQ